ncbi:MAG: hypothetical protein PVF93_01485 [Chromatiaceae bacterium]|jgi:hypothetical protein
MQAFAKWVMKGRMQAVIAATVSAMLALIITPLSVISAAVVALAVLRQGWREGLLVVGSALLAIGGLGGLVFQMPVGAALVGLMLWAPAAILGGIMGRTGSLRIAIEAAAVGAGAIVVLQYLLLGDPGAFWAETLNALVAAQVEAAGAEQTAELGNLITAASGWMAGGVAAAWFLATLGALLLARYWASTLDRPGAFGEEFRELRFGRWLLILVPLLLVVGIVITGGEPSLLGQLYLVGMMVFLIQGLSVAHALVHDFAASTAWLVGLYLMVVLIAPQGATMVAAAGYADGWLNFRAKARARRSRTDDDQ